MSCPRCDVPAPQNEGIPHLSGCFVHVAPGPVRTTNLVQDATAFVGREEALARLERDSTQGRRLITLLGPGGVGKTRLARRFGARMAEQNAYPGGVWFCDLTETHDLQGLSQVLGKTLDVSLGSSGSDAALLQLGHALHARGRVLVILDNFEQLASTASATLQKWLELAPEASLVITSREMLGLRGEHRFELAPLSVPDQRESETQRIAETEAVQLFVRRAATALGSYTLTDIHAPIIAGIVRKLEGLPLSIELAAARMRVLSPKEILERLGRMLDLLRADIGDRSDKQTSLRGAIAWSWLLLSSSERLVLKACSVFRGGVSLDALRQVAELPSVLDEVELIESLVDKSMLRTMQTAGGAPQIGMYESIREFCGEMLQRDGLSTLFVQRHAAYFGAQAAALAAQLRTSKAQQALRHIDEAFDNLVVMVERTSVGDPPEMRDNAVRAVVALDGLLALRGPLGAAESLVTRVLPFADDRPNLVTLLRAKARLVPPQQAVPVLHEALRVAIEDEDPDASAQVHVDLSIVHRKLAGFDDAYKHIALAQALAPRPGSWTEGYVLGNLGNLEAERNKTAEARTLFERAIEIFGQVADREYEAHFTVNLGYVLQSEGQLDDAAAKIDHALTLLVPERDQLLQGTASSLLGMIRWRQNRVGEASALFESSLERYEKAGDQQTTRELVLPALAATQAVLGQLPLAEVTFARASVIPAEGLSPVATAFHELMGAHLHLARARQAEAEHRAEEARRHRASAAEALRNAPRADTSIDIRYGVDLLKHALEANANE